MYKIYGQYAGIYFFIRRRKVGVRLILQGQVIHVNIRNVEWVSSGIVTVLSFYDYTMLDIAPVRN